MSLEQHIPADYLDYTGRDDLLSGGVKLIPLSRRPRAPSRSLDQADRQFPGDEDAAPALRAGCDARVPRGLRQLLPRRCRHRVLLLRPARLPLLRPAGRAGPVGGAAVRRRSGAGEEGTRPGPGELLPVRGQSWGGILAIEYALKYQRHLKGLGSSPT
jgi:proline iminopeptidase